jgi:predicted secreted protein
MEITTRTQSETLSKFAPAFVKAQAAIKNAAKDKANSHFNTSYADLASVMDACRDALNGHGIAVIQRGAPAPTGKLGMETILLHESGEWIGGTGEVALGRGDGPQSYGSAITYARRYFLAAMVGVCPEDDDAEAAEGRGKQRQGTQPAAPAQKAARPADGATAEERAIAEEWARCVVESIRGRDGFTKEGVTAAANAILARYGVKRLRDVPRAKWAELDKAIVSGALDKYAKGEPKAQAAAA